ncbi:uncharacterized protein LOC126562709 [Anopheles maculipalpis]|uniref:uncharacterized protein LOC126562709 n=1 Tax=Anopheles maculipalpis TaxID=1496333 RepID=UPI0021594719|nr:uncharacterized protein LOC126562709 [Anopheles maculipalpis]
MPIVKEKTMQHDLQNAFEMNLRRKSSRTVSIHRDNDEVKDEFLPRHEHANDTDLTQQIKPVISATIQSVASAECTVELNEHKESRQIKMKEFQLQNKSHIAEIVALRESKIDANDDKIVQIGLSYFAPDNGAMTVAVLMQLMSKARAHLSHERRKLLLAMRRLKRYQIQNFQLDSQMQNASLEQYYELKAEVNRIGEKLEETNKRMNNSRQLFENDVARATHVREKLFDSQNQTVILMQDVSKVKQNFFYFKRTLCAKLLSKKQLRKENEHLKQDIQLLNLMPWYGQTYEQIGFAKSLIEKFK